MFRKVNTPGVATFSVDSYTVKGRDYVTQIYPWGGVSCTCKDYVYRQKDAGGVCKHIRDARKVLTGHEEEARH